MDDPVFGSVPIGREPAASLVAAMGAEVGELYDGLEIDGPDMPKAGPGELGPPGGDFLVGWLDRRAVACGGVKRLDERACEFKRMYVLPTDRGRGLARRLLGALEDRARELGFTVARLDTGPRQPASRSLFESCGYRPIENFNGNPMADFFGEKAL